MLLTPCALPLIFHYIFFYKLSNFLLTKSRSLIDNGKNEHRGGQVIQRCASVTSILMKTYSPLASFFFLFFFLWSCVSVNCDKTYCRRKFPITRVSYLQWNNSILLHEHFSEMLSRSKSIGPVLCWLTYEPFVRVTRPMGSRADIAYILNLRIRWDSPRYRNSISEPKDRLARILPPTPK